MRARDDRIKDRPAIVIGRRGTPSLRLATFNLESLDDKPGLKPDLSQRIAAIRPHLQRLAADVLCLQEVNGQRLATGQPRGLHALERLLEGSDYESFHRISTRGPKGVGVADVHNLVVLSRWPIVDSQALHHDLVPPPTFPVTVAPNQREAMKITWDRPLLYGAIALPGGRTLHIINLHLRAPLAAAIAGQKAGPFRWNSVAGWAEGFFLAALKRCGQALEARLWVERLFDQDAESWIAVCGDFNGEEQEMPLRTIRGDTADVGNVALAARALFPLEHDLPRSDRFTVLHGGRRVLLDHILASRPLAGRLLGLSIDNQGLEDELVAHAKQRRSPESFHAAMVAAFDLR